MYWIGEREQVRRKRELGFPKPWSQDPIFQRTYFCNVRREDDRVTKYLRNVWLPRTDVNKPEFELAVIAARFINWPDTLEDIPAPDIYVPDWINEVEEALLERADDGLKVWGNAYVITTRGLRMGKPQYLASVLRAAWERLGALNSTRQWYGSPPSLQRAYGHFTAIDGIGSFLAGQIIADLKNHPGHILTQAVDWHDWSTHGPGSLRGLTWFWEKKITPTTYYDAIYWAWRKIADHVEYDLHRQDFQNCLCEYDKYMRIFHGTGRSKRSYPGC